ncbi:MAG: squalene synthase HpnD [Gemmatimonadetes bacterium]|nr:squalene synthase HpnD [Gemmatimonadota bacterium]
MTPAIRRHTISTAYSVCGGLTRKAARNFYLAFLLLPAEMRRSIYAAYAFSRRVDDIADGAAAPPRKQVLLDRCRQDVHRAAKGSARRWDPVSVALADAMVRHRIPAEYLLGLIDGMEMDLRVNRYSRFDDLFQYCYRAASLVGLICIEIFGYRGAEEARRHAIDLGIAMQLTNILRDVSEDASRGRIYLPSEDLARFGVSEEELRGGRSSPEFRRLMAFQVGRARTYFRRGRELLPLVDPAGRLCVQTLGAVYIRLLDLIEAREYDVLSSRVRISSPAKLRLALGAWLGAAPSW